MNDALLVYKLLSVALAHTCILQFSSEIEWGTFVLFQMLENFSTEIDETGCL